MSTSGCSFAHNPVVETLFRQLGNVNCTLINAIFFGMIMLYFHNVSFYSAMKYDEFQRHVGKAGMTLSEFAHLLKMRRNSITNYAKRGEVPSHLAVIAVLLGAMADGKLEFRSLLENIDIEPKKPRGGAGKGRFGGTQ